MNKEQQFIKAIENLKKFLKEREKLQDVLKVISPTSTGVVEIGGEFIDDYIDVMKIAFNDQYNHIDWFVFENDFGENEFDVTIDNKETKITNSEVFYRVFLKDNENK